MITCEQCQGDIDSDTTFCPHCGAPTQPQATNLACPGCQATVPLDAQFCPVCGLPIATSFPGADDAQETGAIATQALAAETASLTRAAAPIAEEAYHTYRTFPAAGAAHAYGEVSAAQHPPVAVGVGGNGDRPALPPRRRARILGRLAASWERLPYWLRLPIAPLLIILVTLIRIRVFGGDWAAAAATGGLTALVLTAIGLALLAAHALAGEPLAPRRSAWLRGVALVLLLVVGLGGVLSGPWMHLAQARTAEASGHWSLALRQYQLAGTRAGVAPGDLVHVYAGWVATDAAGLPYRAVLSSLASAAASPKCAAACQRMVTQTEARAYYQYGATLARQHQTSGALAELQIVQTRFAKSAYAAPAHKLAATELLSVAQQVQQSSCTTARDDYTTLANQYGDTPEGHTAAQALTAPVDLSMVVSHIPSIGATTFYLSHSVKSANDGYHTFIFSDDYQAKADSSGHITFSQVTPGKYNLSAVGPQGITYWYYAASPNNVYTVTVGAVCPVNAGTFSYP